MAAAQSGSGALNRLLLRAAYATVMAGASCFLAVAAFTQFVRGDLDISRDTLSLYLHGPWGLTLRCMYGVLAGSVVVLGAALYRHADGPRRSAAVPLLWALAALGLLGVAVGDSWLPTCARSAEETDEILARDRMQLVLVDHNLPGTSGRTFAQRLRSLCRRV